MTSVGFDSQAVAFVADHEEGCRRLMADELEPLGIISDASNGTMLCRLGPVAQNLFAIYKPGSHERPLWDFPGKLYLREVAAYEVSEFLGWGLVPPTVVRDGPRGTGSAQLFVPHDPAEHYFTLVEAEDSRFDEVLACMAAFDMVTNNTDRKGGHILRHVRDDRLYAIDNGLTFHVEPKLRTVIWDLPDVPFAEAWKDDLRRLSRCILDDEPFADRLAELLTASEVQVLARRAGQVARMDAMPDMDPDDRWYPWPPV